MSFFPRIHGFCNRIVTPLLDKDGNAYTTVTIGSQEWIVENFRSTKYADGSAIPNITRNTTIDLLAGGSWSDFGAPSQNFDTLTVTDSDIDSAIADGTHLSVARFLTDTVTEYGLMQVTFNITLNSGSLPYIFIQDSENDPLFLGEVQSGANTILVNNINSVIDDNFFIYITNSADAFTADPTTNFATNFSLTEFTCQYIGWDSDAQGAYCAYDNDNNNIPVYGLLYNWYATDNAKGFAYLERSGVEELGWRVPSDDDYIALVTGLGGTPANAFVYYNNASGGLKEIGTDHWNIPNTGATNATGFTAVGAGVRSSSDGTFASLKTILGLHTSTEHPLDESGRCVMYAVDTRVLISAAGWHKGTGYSIRLVRDI